MFSPGRPPQVEKQGQLTPVPVAQLSILRPEDTARIAGELLGGNETALRTLKEQGACDLSYSLPSVAGSGSTSSGSAARSPSSCG